MKNNAVKGKSKTPTHLKLCCVFSHHSPFSTAECFPKRDDCRAGGKSGCDCQALRRGVMMTGETSMYSALQKVQILQNYW